MNGEEINQFLARASLWQGFKERLRKEAKREKNIRFIERSLQWPRDKRRRFWSRYDRWVLYRLNRDGPGLPDPEVYEDLKQEQREIQRLNKLNKEHYD